MMRDLAGVRLDEVGLRRPLQSLCLNPLHPAANAHGVLPRDPVIGGSLATLQGHRKRPPLLPRPRWIRSGPVNFTPNQLWPNPQGS